MKQILKMQDVELVVFLGQEVYFEASYSLMVDTVGVTLLEPWLRELSKVGN